MTTQNWCECPDGEPEYPDHLRCERDALRREVEVLTIQKHFAAPPAGLFLAENGHGHLCIWLETEDERFPRQLFNLAHDTSVEFYETLKPWLERVLPYRQDES